MTAPSNTGLYYFSSDIGSFVNNNYIKYVEPNQAVKIYTPPPVTTEPNQTYLVVGFPVYDPPPGYIFGGWKYTSYSGQIVNYPRGTIFMPGDIFPFNYNQLINIYLCPNWILKNPCFLENTKILCKINNKEQYLPIQEITKGTLVKTTNGFKPVNTIGTRRIYNPGNNNPSKNRLYLCSKQKYPELLEDLYITGGHRIYKKIPINKSSMLSKTNFLIDKYESLLIYKDKRAKPWEKEGTFNIWHLAVDCKDEKANFRIYANGLLAQSSSIYHMKKYDFTIVNEFKH